MVEKLVRVETFSPPLQQVVPNCSPSLQGRSCNSFSSVPLCWHPVVCQGQAQIIALPLMMLMKLLCGADCYFCMYTFEFKYYK